METSLMVDSCHFRGPYDRAGGMAAGKHRHFTSSKVKITLPKRPATPLAGGR